MKINLLYGVSVGIQDTEKRNVVPPQKYCKKIIDVKMNDSSPTEAGSDNNNELLKCSDCDYTCKCDSNLKEHEKTHMGEKSFLCAEWQCGVMD